VDPPSRTPGFAIVRKLIDMNSMPSFAVYLDLYAETGEALDNIYKYYLFICIRPYKI
jgi:hypothetical protein